MKNRKGTFLPPDRHNNVPSSSKWLGGQGAGTWFYISKEKLKSSTFRVRRISAKGNLDCDRIFTLEKSKHTFYLSKEWDIIPISHCAIVRVKQDGIIFTMHFCYLAND